MKHTSIHLDTEDTTELYFIIKSRGQSTTRNKLLNAIRVLDFDLATRIEKEDKEQSDKWINRHTKPL